MKTAIAPAPESVLAADSVQAFLSLVNVGVEQITAAAKMLHRLVAADESTIAKVREQAPHIPIGFLEMLLRVGEGSLHAELMLNGCPAYRRLRTMPFSMQESALRHRTVDLVADPEKSDVLRVPMTELTLAQTNQVLDSSGVRDRDAQLAYLRRLRASKAVDEVTKDIRGTPYHVRKHEVVVVRPCVLTKADIIRLLGEMTS